MKGLNCLQIKNNKYFVDMMNLESLFPVLIPWLCLVFTIGCAWLKPKLWPIALLITLILAWFLEAIAIQGLAFVALLLGISFVAQRSENSVIKGLLTAVVILGCLALAAHLLPGFNNLLVLNEVNKSANSAPFSLYLNLDKPMILFVLLMLVPNILQNNRDGLAFVNLNKFQLPSLILTMFIVIFSLAIAFSLVQYEPNLPSWWWLFALNNLILTCMVEEVFFRGFIQRKLSIKFSPVAALILTSLLFGVAHFAGGPFYIIVTTIAGLLYGGIYLRTGNIWHAILIHFSLNMMHLLFFTYPLLKLD